MLDSFAHLLDAVPDALVIVDACGAVVLANRQAELLFGYPRAELLGRPVETLVPEHWRARHAAHWATCANEPQPRSPCPALSLYGLRKDGSEFPVEIRFNPLPSEQGLLVLSAIREVTALEQQVQELQAANRALLRSNQELDEFADIAAHDLKEPLRGIASYCQFLIEDHAERLDDDGRTKLQTIERLSQRLFALVDSLHEYARLGRVQMAVTPVDLNTVLADVLDGLGITLDEQRVEVRVPRPLPTLPCDRVHVGEVFHNLIANAIKYNDRPHKWVEVGWTEAEGPGRPTALYVRDNGIGIREQNLKAVFRIFKRLHARDQYGGGTGVGLTLAKRIVERHGGRIWAESIPGEGSTFRFTLSSQSPSASEDLSSQSPSASEDGPRWRSGSDC